MWFLEAPEGPFSSSSLPWQSLPSTDWAIKVINKSMSILSFEEVDNYLWGDWSNHVQDQTPMPARTYLSAQTLFWSFYRHNTGVYNKWAG
jgi:hypothetical protein